MQNERGGRDFRDPFSMFGELGSFGDFGGSIFGSNPFDDPFFTRPFGSIFDRRIPSGNTPPVTPPTRPVIQELGSDDDDDAHDDDGEGMVIDEQERQKGTRPVEPFVNHPDDEPDDETNHGNQQQSAADGDSTNGTKPQTFKVHSCRVSYGGMDGVYYNSSATRKMGSAGVIMEECKEADKRTGEATHRISRGLQDKGHSVTRKLNSDGRVDTMQTLHNINEDELGTFDDAWKGNTEKHLPSLTGSSGSQVDPLSENSSLTPASGHVRHPWGWHSDHANGFDPPRGRTRNVVRIPID